MAVVILDPLLARQAPRLAASLTAALSPTDPPFSVGIACGRGIEGLVSGLDPPLLPICVDRDEALLGPLFVPGRSTCPGCLVHWLRLRFYDRADEAWDVAGDSASLLSSTLVTWFDRFRREGRLEGLAGTAQSINLRTGAWARHPVFRRSDCAWCRQVSGPAQPPALEVHCSPWTGIVPRLELTRTPAAGAFRATAVWTPPMPSGSSRSHLQRRQSYGRGLTALDARRGCIAEALERYSLVYRGDERLVRARFRDVDAIDPREMLLFSATQFAGREAWNEASDELLHVPEPFDPDTPIDWLAAQPLGSATAPTLAAAATCLMWYEFGPAEPAFARADTIGCASGSTFEDALYRALLEAVERDAMAIWWDNRLQRPGVRPESFASPDIDDVVIALRALDRELYLLDCTTDIGIPCYVAVAPRSDGTEPLIAAAADLVAQVAAYRAASEVGQVWYEARRTETLSPLFGSWLLDASITAHPYLAPASLRDAPRPRHAATVRRSSVVVEHLEAVGLRAYAVDHSRTDVCIPTVRAVVPGLRHIWNRRAPGRLYDVPVTLGWRGAPVDEAGLNPVRCMV